MAHVWNKRLRVLLCVSCRVCPAVCVLLCQTFVPNVRHVVLARHDANALWLSVCTIRRTTSLGYYAVEPLRGSAGCTGVLVRRVRRVRWSPRVLGAQSAQVPHVLGEDVTSAACGRISCVPTLWALSTVKNEN